MTEEDAKRIDALRNRWQQYDRAYMGDRSVPFDASREDVIAAYVDWVDAVDGAVIQPAFEAREGGKLLRSLGIGNPSQ